MSVFLCFHTTHCAVSLLPLASPQTSEWCTPCAIRMPVTSRAIRIFQLHYCARRPWQGVPGDTVTCIQSYTIEGYLSSWRIVGNSASVACGGKLLTCANIECEWSFPALGQMCERTFHPEESKPMTSLEIFTERTDELLKGNMANYMLTPLSSGQMSASESSSILNMSTLPVPSGSVRSPKWLSSSAKMPFDLASQRSTGW